MLGLTENDYKIDRPKRKRHDYLTGDGTIRVEVVLDNWEYAPHLDILEGDNYQDFRGEGEVNTIICVLYLLSFQRTRHDS